MRSKCFQTDTATRGAINHLGYFPDNIPKARQGFKQFQENELKVLKGEWKRERRFNFFSN